MIKKSNISYILCRIDEYSVVKVDSLKGLVFDRYVESFVFF